MNADARAQHFRRLRELEARMLSCRTHEQEESVQKLIDQEHQRWTTLQLTTEAQTKKGN